MDPLNNVISFSALTVVVLGVLPLLKLAYFRLAYCCGGTGAIIGFVLAYWLRDDRTGYAV